jgi:signal transduction histidine kinase
MKLVANTIARRLFVSLGILVAGIIFIALLSLFTLWKARSIDKISLDINNQRVLITQLLKSDLEFLRFETVNQEYFKTAYSSLLLERDSLARAIRIRNATLHQTMFSNSFEIDRQFAEIDSAINEYNLNFALLITKINQRGFKDYGLEGKMRSSAHRLENISSSIPLTSLLSLRRHEKDFLLRKEDSYIELFNSLAEKLIKSLQPRDSVLIYLVTYKDAFNKLTALDKEIGILPTEGLTGRLNQQTTFISEKLNRLTYLSNARAEELVHGSAVFFVIVCLITTIACTILTYYTSMRLARPIKKLSNTMGKFMINEGLDDNDIDVTVETNEIHNLSQSFVTLSRKLKAQFNEIKQSSLLLEAQNEELKKLNEELDRFIYSAAHDLKSPLTSLDGLVRLAQKEINSAEHAHYFKMMHDSIFKLYGFILDITDYAKNKRQKLKVEKINLEKLIYDITDGLKFLPYAERVTLKVEVQGIEFYSDKTRLDIILKNIISNSYHYLDFRKANSVIRIEASVHNNFVRIQVTDNGIGIDAQHLPKIFDMFYRAVEQSKGTGIGLFLVKESLKMLHGKISVKSTLGQWTQFNIHVPNLKDWNANTTEAESIIFEEVA